MSVFVLPQNNTPLGTRLLSKGKFYREDRRGHLHCRGYGIL